MINTHERIEGPKGASRAAAKWPPGWGTERGLDLPVPKPERFTTKNDRNLFLRGAGARPSQIDAQVAKLGAELAAKITAAAIERKFASFKTEITREALGPFFARSGLVLAPLELAR